MLGSKLDSMPEETFDYQSLRYEFAIPTLFSIEWLRGPNETLSNTTWFNLLKTNSQQSTLCNNQKSRAGCNKTGRYG
jgi:hypothetical protein